VRRGNISAAVTATKLSIFEEVGSLQAYKTTKNTKPKPDI